MRDVRSRFNVSSACCRRSHHSCSGNVFPTVHKPAMKWFLNVRIALLAAFKRWLFASTNWIVVFILFLTKFLTTMEHSLSITCNFGVKFLFCKCWYASLKGSSMHIASGLFIGLTNMVFASYTYAKNKYWLFL